LSDIISPADPTDFFCSDLSRESGESLPGTAPTVDLWLLLEYAGPWAAKATEDNDLPPSIRAWLAQAMSLAERGRLQFIKQSRPSPAVGLTLFVALTREIAPLLYQFHLNSYDDLLALDLGGLLADPAAYAEHRRREPLYLVCTNGRRDRCCARHGPALYQAFDEQVGDAAWQSTHLGGHRFAPTLATFPGGAIYGRLAPADLPPMIQAQEAGELYLSHLRGRSCYDEVTQAADFFLRQETGLRAIDDYRLLGALPGDDNQWLVRFSVPSTAEVYLVIVTRTLSELAQMVSCSPAKYKPAPHFQLLSIGKEK